VVVNHEPVQQKKAKMLKVIKLTATKKLKVIANFGESRGIKLKMLDTS
jgi:hypothetical protein